MFDNTSEADEPVSQSESEADVRAKEAAFPFARFPRDTFFHDRRGGRDRRDLPASEAPATVAAPPAERRAKKERRRRIDPTTFEKQYTDDEMEFMNAMQRFKVHTGKSFPTNGDVLRIAHALGYRRVEPPEDEPGLFPSDQDDPAESSDDPLQNS
jgi:hypothetical protein